MRLAYLYSRFPVISQTFCDMEMLELQRRGHELLIGSIHPPHTSLRHGHFERFRSPVCYAPPASVVRLWEKKIRRDGRWPAELIARHERKYGPEYKAGLRARNACYFAALFAREGIRHFHVHFANRAAHTALFLKAISGIPFSITAHGQDFMSDLGQNDLLREICAEAEFIAVETDYSGKLLRKRCPEAAEKIHRVYNGLDLAHLPASVEEQETQEEGPTRIVSIGRLVPFKGFEILLKACAELARRGLDFRCEIVGDGPLREKLTRMIAELKLEQRVVLSGSLPQSEVYARLRGADIFALACVVDAEGASDVFPTVIMEAMACARPVVSTQLAGVPESVVDGATGLLVPSGDDGELADALARLIADPELRQRMGEAGRARLRSEFRVSRTVEPLLELFQKCLAHSPVPPDGAGTVLPRQTAYLVDRWLDPRLPFLGQELEALGGNQVPFVAFLFHPPSASALESVAQNLALEFEYLPDAMVVEAEWQANLPLVRELEAARANQAQRPPSDLFLEQARIALILRRIFRRHNIVHVHATSSRTLLAALMLNRLLGLTVSAAIEAKPVLSEPLLQQALDRCLGGRSAEREMPAARGAGFLFDPTVGKSSAHHVGSWLSRTAKIKSSGGRAFWQEWSRQLLHWTRMP